MRQEAVLGPQPRDGRRAESSLPKENELREAPMPRRIPIAVPNNAPERSVPQVGEMATALILLTAFVYVVGAHIVLLDLDRYGVSNFDLMPVRYLVTGAYWLGYVITLSPPTVILVLVLRRTSTIISEAINRAWEHHRDRQDRAWAWALAVFRFCLPGVSPERFAFGFIQLSGRLLLIRPVFPLIAPEIPPSIHPPILIQIPPVLIASVFGGLFLFLLLSDVHRLHWEAESTANLGVLILIAFDIYLFLLAIAFYTWFVYPTLGELGGGKKPRVALQLTENINIDWHSAGIRASQDGKTVCPVELLFDTPTTVTIASPEAAPSAGSPFLIPVGPKAIELERRIINAVRYIPSSESAAGAQNRKGPSAAPCEHTQ